MVDFRRTRALFQCIRIFLYSNLGDLWACQTTLAVISDDFGHAKQVKPWGRNEAPGRPTRWVATPCFLTQFGLRTLRDLPTSHPTRANTGHSPGSAAHGDQPLADGGELCLIMAAASAL